MKHHLPSARNAVHSLKDRNLISFVPMLPQLILKSSMKLKKRSQKVTLLLRSHSHTLKKSMKLSATAMSSITQSLPRISTVCPEQSLLSFLKKSTRMKTTALMICSRDISARSTPRYVKLTAISLLLSAKTSALFPSISALSLSRISMKWILMLIPRSVSLLRLSFISLISRLSTVTAMLNSSKIWCQ